MSCQEEYETEWAEDWDRSTKEQRKELEDSIKVIISQWLDKYDLRPKFFTFKKSEFVEIDKEGEVKE